MSPRAPGCVGRPGSLVKWVHWETRCAGRLVVLGDRVYRETWSIGRLGVIGDQARWLSQSFLKGTAFGATLLQAIPSLLKGDSPLGAAFLRSSQFLKKGESISRAAPQRMIVDDADMRPQGHPGGPPTAWVGKRPKIHVLR